MQIKEKLSNIPTEYQPVPFWSWNDKLEPDELRRQIRWMKDNGIGGFFMHARGGLNTKYMSKEWMECIEACCDEAQKNQMDAWGYDENGWPSGFAGGKLLEDVNNLDHYLEHSFGKYDKEADLSYTISGDDVTIVKCEDDNSDVKDNDNYLNIYVRRAVSTVDILNPEIVKKFINNTHEKYKEYFGDEFSKKFKGFFTDEPQFYRGGGTPYSVMMIEYFKNEYNEDLNEKLGLLFVKKKDWRQFRYRYWLSMQRLMIESFAKQIYSWCEDNDVQFTGHYIEENTMGHQVVCCGGIMPFYAYMHIPGIDWLIDETRLELGPRQLGSVAKQFGKKHALTETFAARGWNCTPRELRRIAGFQYANGVNFMCHHLMPYSEHGQRKRDYPIHFNPANPWVKENFKEFNDYFTRLGYLLATGEEDVKVAMLHPIRSTYFEFSKDKEAEEFGLIDIERNLRESMRIFSARGIPFHFIDETLMEDYGFVDNDKIGCGECSYDYLVLPHIETMGKHTEKLIRQYVENGGKVLILDNVPKYLEGEKYEYSYLNSNCTLEEIIDEHLFKVADTNNELFYAYRLIDNRPMVFVQNASKTDEYVQTFEFGEKYKSMISLNLNTFEQVRLGNTITILPNESIVLLASEETFERVDKLKKVDFKFENAKVEFETNYMTIDEVCYSKNGINYSKPIYVNKLFDQLLNERYDGKLWIQYSFDVDVLPKNITLMVEKDNATGGFINNRSLEFNEKWEDDHTFYKADISKDIVLGKNTYEIVIDWNQTEETYYALFGENVTESLKNCIVYKNEIEAIYLCGKFGVYSREKMKEHMDNSFLGHDFYVGEIPNIVNELATDGFPFFRGNLKLSNKVSLDKKDIMLNVKGNYLMAKVWINNQKVGDLFFEKQIDISDYAKEGDNLVEVEFVIGNRNMFGPLHLDGTEWFISPFEFTLCDLPEEKNGVMEYRLQRFY